MWDGAQGRSELLGKQDEAKWGEDAIGGAEKSRESGRAKYAPVLAHPALSFISPPSPYV